jgi:shikimate dehydrogenase
MGAGGAARAISVELALAGASDITVYNRSAGRGRELAARIADSTGVSARFKEWSDAIQVPPGSDVVVNATSIGLYPDVNAVPPLDFSSLNPDILVADVIPNPPQTPFLRRAAELGCPTLDGLGMLVNQGRIGIRLWTGVDPDALVMRKSLEEIFGQAGASESGA